MSPELYVTRRIIVGLPKEKVIRNYIKWWRSQWPSGLKRGFCGAARLLELRGGNPPGAWMFVLCVLYSKDKRHIHHNQDKEVVQMN